MAHTCRGTISLVSAVIHTEDNCNFVISNGATQTFHLRAMNEIERQKWVTALELHKARAIRHQESDDDDELDLNDDKNEVQTMLKTLAMKLQDVHTCHDLIIKHGAALQRSLAELEQLDIERSASANSVNDGSTGSAQPRDANLLIKSKTVNERATLFRITSNAMINACAEYLHLAQTHGQKWQKLLQHEHQQRLRLEEMVEQLAKQHSKMEEDVKKELANSPNNQTGNKNPPSSLPKQPNSKDEDEDEEFYDAEDTATDFFVSFPGKAHRISVQMENDPNSRTQSKKLASIRDNSSYDASSGSEDGGGLDDSDVAGVVTRKKNRHLREGSDRPDNASVGSSSTGRMDGDTESNRSLSQPGTPISDRHRMGSSLVPAKRRRREIPERPNHSLNLWSIMKNCIGKELTKIPMPVYFNEPLSMLQRLTEDFEYADLLHKAAKCKDSLEQMVYVAVFSVSSYSTTANRLGKPFNPLLGETYECDRTDDLGWRCFSEQVSTLVLYRV